MQTATRSTSQALEILQQSVLAQTEQIRAILEKLDNIPERREVAEVAEQVLNLGELLSGVEEKLARGEQILTALDEYQFGPIPWDGAVLKRIMDRRQASRVLETMEAKLPAGSTTLVVSKGDELLVASKRLRCWHFPQNTDGVYSGFHPADSGSAIVQLEALRAKGAEYIVLPCASFWWLDHYSRFRDYLDQRYGLLYRADDLCAIFALQSPSGQPQRNAWIAFENTLAEIERRIQRDPAVLDWATGYDLHDKFPCRTIFSPPFVTVPPVEPDLPYLDATIDVVAVRSSEPSAIDEARRVAQFAVLTFDDESTTEPKFEIEWIGARQARGLPSTSIIIPSYNGISLTEDCIRALQETLPADFQTEIIVVDDASTDDTPSRMLHLAQQDERIKSVRNAENLGFVGTCNRGAELARGDILIFLNNDTLPQPGWLEPLLSIFENYTDAGAVGGKLVYPDGRLQEAGGVIFSDGSAANMGRGDFEIDAPLYNYVRQVDYVTGALIATPRKLFEQLGGLDLRYRPIYYEETDYCFRVREAGFKVYYQPLSVVIHLEGVTCGTDASTGQKRYQLLNQQKFIKRWRDVLRLQPDNPHHFDAWTWYSLAVREERTIRSDEQIESDKRSRKTCRNNNGHGKEGAAL
jgi:GT2 family glycosyltransferase